MEYTKRKNLNRGFIKLEAWQRAMDLFDLVFRCTTNVPDFKLRSQVRDAAQSVSANIAEGYCRRSLAEYLQFLYIAKGSLGESLTRTFSLARVGLVPGEDAEKIDSLQYEAENILLGLIRSLEDKRSTGSWEDALPVAFSKTAPPCRP
jgi:four helix bundle protein